MPTIISINIGLAVDRSYPDPVERTAIGKLPQAGPVRITRLGPVGDQQVDLKHHGGPDRALCTYVADHHPGWVGALGATPTPGLFGENLTVQVRSMELPKKLAFDGPVPDPNTQWRLFHHFGAALRQETRAL